MGAIFFLSFRATTWKRQTVLAGEKRRKNRGIFGIFVLFAGAVHARREAGRSCNKLELEGPVGGEADGLKRNVCPLSLRRFLF